MPHNALRTGSVLASRFRLEDLLEETEGARFWRATDLALARSVAVHLLPADDPRAPELLAAARRSATITDPRLLRVLDALEEEGHLAVVHEWSSGASLDHVLNDGPLDPRRAAWLVREVAEAMVVAHRNGVPHGRLIPENVMINDAGAVKLIGFAVSDALYGAHDPGPDKDPATAPATGGDRESARAGRDIRDLGALLYASLTGRWPGTPGSSLPEAPSDHGQVMRARQVRAGVPRPLDLLCAQLLSSTPPEGADAHRGRDRGPQSAAAVSSALTEYLGGDVAMTAFDGPNDGPSDEPSDGETTQVLDVGSLAGAGDETRATPVVGQDPGATQAAPFAELVGRADAGRPATAEGDTTTGDTATGGRATGDRADRATAFPRGGTPWPAVHGAPPAASRAQGGLPEHWGPDGDGTGEIAVTPGPAPSPGTSWIKVGTALGAVLLLVLGGMLVLNQLGGGDPGPNDSRPGASAAGTGKTLELASVVSFDPDQSGGGAPEENPDEVPLATDGDPATSWTTLRYNDGPALAPYKGGVGLLIDLGSEQQVSEAEVTLDGGPYGVQLLAAPEGGEAPTDVAGLTTLAENDAAADSVTLKAESPTTTRYLVVWLTALPPVSGGFMGGVAEVVVRS